MKMDLSLSNLITKAARVVKHSYQREVMPSGISPSQAGKVYILNRLGSSSQVEIASVLHLDKANTNSMEKKLQSAGFIVLSRDPDDARKTIIELSDNGLMIG